MELLKRLDSAYVEVGNNPDEIVKRLRGGQTYFSVENLVTYTSTITIPRNWTHAYLFNTTRTPQY